ncbi:MAG: aminoacyl-tRNA hydrolase [Candidatus Omnitrophota bacterium]
MKIIVGLGNPGLKYRNTRHNAGFLALKVLADKYNIKIKKKGYNGIYGIGRIKQHEVMLFEPLTYMNLSGEAVFSVCSSKLESWKDLIVISDDINLSLGTIRLREKGSAGGHNGLKSIIAKIGQEFARLRIGVGADFEIEDVSSYVLSAFKRSEKGFLKESLIKAQEAVEMWLLTEDIKQVMNRYNGQNNLNN